MTKEKTKNLKRLPKKKLNHTNEINKLRKQIIQLQTENNLLKTFNKPSASQKIEIIEEFLSWVADEGNDANTVHSFFEYKNKLKKEEKHFE